MHAESLVRAENQPQQSNESVMMMDLIRDGNISDSYLTPSQTIENLPELDLEIHFTSNDPEVQKVEYKILFFVNINLQFF